MARFSRIAALLSSAPLLTASLTQNPVMAQCQDWADGFGIPGNGINGEVFTLVTFDDGSGPALYAGGNFSEAGGIAANGIARWDGSAWSPVGSGLGNVQALVIHDDGTGPALYAGGQFVSVGGVPFNRMAKWDGAAWQPLGSGMDNNISALASFDPDGAGPIPAMLYAGGAFTMAGGVSANRIAQWDGSAWSPVDSSGPVARSASGLAYDPARGQSVLFGGFGNGSYFGDTWAWNGAAWIRVATTGPAPRDEVSMVYDPLRQRVLLVGGRVQGGGNGGWSDIWAWDGAVWSELAASFLPSRRGLAVAFDPARDRLVLFGGRDGGGVYHNNTYEWDGVAWQLVDQEDPEFPELTPSRRAYHAMTYDAARGRVVLFGGVNSVDGLLGDTWEWDGASWTRRDVPGPAARIGHQLAYDDDAQRVVLYGGSSGPSGPDGIAWSWDGTDWMQLPGIGSTESTVLSYDTGRNRFVAYDEEGTTWEYNGAAWSAHGGGPNGTILALHAHDDGTGAALYAGGTFNRLSGLAISNIARWNGAAWSSVGGNANNAVRAFVSDPSGGLCVGGSFTNIGGVTVNGVARWNGSAWSPVGSLGRPVNALAYADHGSGPQLYATGSFGLGGPTMSAARWNGVAWQGLGTGMQGIGRALALDQTTPADGRLFFGGDILSAGGKPSRGVAMWPVPCSAPIIIQQPPDTAAVFGEPIVLNIGVVGTAPISYQWRKDGMPLADGANISGSSTAQLLISYWSLNDVGTYDVVVTNALGEVTSEGANLSIPFIGGSGEPVAVTTLIYPPEPVPNRPGENYSGFQDPTVSSDGQVLFVGLIPVRALSLWDGAAAPVLHAQAEQAPGLAPGVAFSQFTSPFANYRLASGGRAVFDALLSGPGINLPINGVTLWHHLAGQSTLVARTGDPAGGVPGGVFAMLGHTSGNAAPAQINDSGRIAFAGTLTSPANNRGLWIWEPGVGQTHVAQQGSVVPGTSVTITRLQDSPRLNNAGQLAFLGGLSTVTGYNYSGSPDEVMFLGQPGAFTVITRSGDPAPGAAPDVNIETFFGSPTLLNDAGQIAFNTFIAGPGGYRAPALYLADTAGLTPVAIMGDAAPGGPVGASFVSPVVYDLADDGELVLVGTLSAPCGSSCASEGVWVRRSTGVLIPVLLNRPGTLPGLPPGYTYLETLAAFLNDSGQLILGLRFTGPSGTVTGVYGWTEMHGLFPIAVAGTQFEVRPGEFRTIAGATLSSSNLTPDGRVFFSAQFTDSTSGILAGDFRDFLYGFYPCPADWSGDTAVNSNDISAFLTDWLESIQQETLVADFNGDMVVNSNDIASFLTTWLDAIQNGC